MKTAKDIQGDIKTLFENSAVARLINGKVYRKGYRPRDSRLEDAVIIFTAGLPEQIQTGVVTVHVYVPDTELGGVYVEDGERTAEIERAVQDWVESLTPAVSPYKFALQATITTEAAPDIQQHFIVAMLRYEYFGSDDPIAADGMLLTTEEEALVQVNIS